jgi:immune inhibitor A
MRQDGRDVTGPDCAMPPGPELLDRILAAKRALLAGRQLRKEDGLDLRAAIRILNRPPRTRPDTLVAPGANLGPVTGSRRALVLLVDFSDAAGTEPQAHFDDLLFSLGSYPTGSMRDFYQEASYGQLDVIGLVSGDGTTPGWYRAPQPKSYYTNGNYGFGGYPQNAQRLVEDVLDLADASVNFADYDNDGDGVVDALVVICAGGGAEQTGNVNDIWSHKWDITPQSRDGVIISRYFMAPEDGRCGVMAHELGHLLMGLPDLYDVDYSSAGTGAWDLMAAGSWNGGGDRPAHPTAWCKVKSGWVNPADIFNASQSVTIPPYETTAQVYRLPVGTIGGSEYFLLSNRQQGGFDDQLPGSGLVIEHCDDTRGNNTDETHYLVDVEQCDGQRDLNMNANRGDSTDPFPSAGNAEFTATSTPNSLAYDGTDTQISVTAITPSGADITADISVGAAGAQQWLYNVQVTATFADHSSQYAWANVDGIGWRQLKDGAPDGVTNLFVMCNEAVGNQRPMHVYLDSTYIYTAYLV